MVTTLARLIGAVAGSVLLATSALAQETVVIGHFGNPTPMQAAAAEGTFSDATGWTVEWRKFASGTDVIAAMASGDIKLAELGSSPFAIAASQGVPIELIAVAQVIGEAESLIVRDGSSVASLEDLKGKRVAVPVGSTAHFSLMGALEHAGISQSDLTIMNMPPDQIAAAWEQDAIDAAFIWQPVQSQILQKGELLVGADQTAQWGYPTFDGWVANTEFAEDNAEAVTSFLKTIDAANAAYLDDPAAWTEDSAPVKAIAERTGADPSQVPGILEGFTFLPLSEQVKPEWLGGSIPKAVQGTAQFLQSVGRIDSVSEDYSAFVDPTYAEAAIE